MKKIIIASDSTTDLSDELIEKYDIKILPISIILDGKEYYDGVDISPDFIYEYYRNTGVLPKTSNINVAKFTDFYEEYSPQCDGIIMFTISSDMSVTNSNAQIAAQPFKNVHVVDTRNLSTGGGLLVLKACEMAEQGKSAEYIADKCRKLAKQVDASFVIDKLEFLSKGGRCSSLTAMGANLLHIRPQIKVVDGKMIVGKKYRGKFERVLIDYINEQLSDLSSIEPDHIFITHAGCDKELCQKCIRLVKSKGYFSNVHFTRAGCAVSSHCGANTLGVLFMTKG